MPRTDLPDVVAHEELVAPPCVHQRISVELTLARAEGPAVLRNDPVRLQLKDRDIRCDLLSFGDDLNCRRSGADHRDRLAGHVQTLGPSRGMAHRTLEVVAVAGERWQERNVEEAHRADDRGELTVVLTRG